MTNFIFKSQGLIKNVDNKLEMIQSELRHQRSEHSLILSKLSLIIHELDIRGQAEDYFTKYDAEHPDKRQTTLVQDPVDPEE